MAINASDLTEFAKRILTAQGIDPDDVKSFSIDMTAFEPPTITVVCFLNRAAADLLSG